MSVTIKDLFAANNTPKIGAGEFNVKIVEIKNRTVSF